MLPESEQKIPNYFLLREVGEGGMGTVVFTMNETAVYRGEVYYSGADMRLRGTASNGSGSTWDWAGRQRR